VHCHEKRRGIKGCTPPRGDRTEYRCRIDSNRWIEILLDGLVSKLAMVEKSAEFKGRLQ
jgi:hypothetical protein